MKKLPVLFLLLFVFLTVPLSVSASEFPSYPPSMGYSVVSLSKNSTYQFFTSDNKILVNSEDSIFVLKGSSKIYKWTGQEWQSISEQENVGSYVPSLGYSSIVKSDHDIFKTDGITIFFSPPVEYMVTVAEMGQVSLGSLMTDFGQTLGTLLPVGLILSSMVLALYLVRRFLPWFGLSNR